MIRRLVKRLSPDPTPSPPEDTSEIRGLSARERHQQDAHPAQARLSARYAAVRETATRIWEMRKAESRREEIHAIIEELLEHGDEDLLAYARRRHARHHDR